MSESVSPLNSAEKTSRAVNPPREERGQTIVCSSSAMQTAKSPSTRSIENIFFILEKFDKLFRALGKVIGRAVIGHDRDHILDSATVKSLDIDAGLVGNNVTS